MKVQNNRSKVRKTFWTVAVFYGLIAFEFFYMASPFAIYFYSAYQPGLNFLENIPVLAWLTSFFLPHIVVETSSFLINSLHDAGIIFFIIGFISFILGAVHIYYNKITKKGAAIGGLYKFIRHPQYVSFAICSFGLLLLWPRFLVLILFITLLFAYYFLARAEERECEQKFGQSYIDYKNKTNMFLPFGFGLNQKLFNRFQNVVGKVLSVVIIYTMTMLISLGLAKALQIHSINSLYTFQQNNSMFLSVGKMEKEKFTKITSIVLSDSSVANIFNQHEHLSAYFLNYVVPSDFYVSEIPMHINESGQSSGHFLPTEFEKIKKFKIIFTRIELPDESVFNEKRFFTANINKEPLIEVWLDLENRKVIDIRSLYEFPRYENIPIPVF